MDIDAEQRSTQLMEIEYIRRELENYINVLNKWSVSSGLTYSVDNGISLTGSSKCGSGLESTVTFSSPIFPKAEEDDT